MAQMIKEGKVIANDNGKLTVRVERNEACGSCAAKDGCTQRGESIIEIYSPDDFKEGDNIALVSNSADLTKFSIYVYILPVVMMIIGAALPQVLLKNTAYDLNLITLVSVLVFLLVSFLIVKGLDKKVKTNNIMKVRKI